MELKMSSAKCWPFCRGHNMLNMKSLRPWNQFRTSLCQYKVPTLPNIAWKQQQSSKNKIFTYVFWILTSHAKSSCQVCLKKRQELLLESNKSMDGHTDWSTDEETANILYNCPTETWLHCLAFIFNKTHHFKGPSHLSITVNASFNKQGS